MRRSLQPRRRRSPARPGAGALAVAIMCAAGCSEPRSFAPGAVPPDGREAEIPIRAAPPPITPNGDALDDPPSVPGDAAPPPASDAASPITDAAPIADAGSPSPDTAPPPGSDVAPPPAPRADARAPADLPAPADLRPPAQVPDGCQIVSCEGIAGGNDCCSAWYFFGVESEDRNQVQRDELVKSFSKGADVRAAYQFDGAGQDGAVGMLLRSPRRITAIKVTSEWSGPAANPPFVSAEAKDGTAGCAYPLRPGGQAHLSHPLFCWGDQGFVADRINVRIEAKAPGAANIRVNAVQVR